MPNGSWSLGEAARGRAISEMHFALPSNYFLPLGRFLSKAALNFPSILRRIHPKNLTPSVTRLLLDHPTSAYVPYA
jgi:hypothetical protein